MKIAGTAAVIAAAGGAGFVGTRTPTAALRAWETAGTMYSDPMRQALSYAILAPNPHNRQPWIVDLKSDTEAVLTCDLDRLLAATDPFSRQIVIGLGCFLELFSIAANEQGYVAQIQYFPDGEPGDAMDQRPVAHLMLTKKKGLSKDPLFAQVMNRHTNREPYDTKKKIDAGSLSRIQAASRTVVSAGTTNDATKLTGLRTLSRDALVAEIRDPAAFQESVDLMRIGKAEIERNPDGISLGGAFLEALSLAGVLSRESLSDPNSSAFQIGIDMAEESTMSSMGFVWINTQGNGRRAQIEAGRAYMRIALQAAAEGVAMQPMSQALQEYPAMIPYYEKVHELLADGPGETVQMLARLGYGKPVGPAPRWPLATRLKEV